MSAATTGRGAEGLGVTIPGADRLIWYFMRVSGIALILLAGGHLFITHYLNVPSDTTFDFVAARWANPLWRSFDWLLLLTALWHGVFGLRYSIQDYIGRPGARVATLAAAYAIGVIFTAVGSVTVFTFDEAAARNNTGPLAGQMWIAEAIGWSLYVFAFITYVAIILVVIWAIRGLAGGGLPIYQGDVGQYAWAMHRATGIGILFFLLVHIIDIMLIGLGRDVYNESVAFYSRIELIPMEILLVGAVVYHTLNGIRVITIDFSRLGYRRERPLFWTVLVLSVLLVLPSAIALIMSHR
jgi:succinate dehydrogenase cytochrome b556 subunit